MRGHRDQCAPNQRNDLQIPADFVLRLLLTRPCAGAPCSLLFQDSVIVDTATAKEAMMLHAQAQQQ